MRLRNLTIKGFKSFANETSLNFNENVIGVVGPNGSGKSNVVDAIRWVLGEQKTKELRLEKMTDVIFNGTRKKKEAPTAHVTLTFDNNKGILPSEYTTVAVSRILYRSGESEYRINGVRSRLKDITTLFLDTGMGSNSYAIIALGMVDDILSDKDNARRQMFEQAAGVSKFKKRKKDTTNKLKATTADLDRVEDLIFEIEGNLKSLEKQAKRAQKYLDIKADYKEASILNAQVSIQSLRDDYKRLKIELDAEKLKYSDLDVLLRQKEAEIEKFKKDNIEQEMSLSAQQKSLNNLIADLRNLESDKGLLEQKKSFKEQSQKGLHNAIRQNNTNIKSLHHEIELLTSRVEKENLIWVDLKQELDKAKTEYDQVKSLHQETKSDTLSKQNIKSQLNNQIFDVDKRVALLENNINNLKEDLSRFSHTVESRKEEHEATITSLSKVESNIVLKEKEVNQLKNKEEDRKLKVEDLQKERDTELQKLADVNRKIDAKQNEHDLLKSMIDNLEGFPESVKYLRNNWKDEAPILSDLLEVQEEYKSVIEQYLENYLNYYVVKDIKGAKEAIDLLTNAQKGKANFFLLNELPEQAVQLSASPDYKPARYYVNVEKEYEKIVDYLLNDVMIYEGNLDGIDALDGDKFTFLSKGGGLIKSKYTISGGSVGLFQGKKIGRKKSLEKLISEIKTLDGQRDRSQKELTEIKFRLEQIKNENVQNDISKSDRELNQLVQERIRLNIRVEGFQKLEEELLQRIDTSNSRESEYDKSLSELIERKKGLTIQLAEIENQSVLYEESLEKLDNKLSSNSEKYNSLNIQYIRHQNLVENLEKDEIFKKSRLGELKETLRKDEIRLKDNDKTIKDIQVEVVVIKGKLEDKYTAKADLEAKLGEVEQSYFQARNVITEAEDEIRRITRNQNQIQLLVQKLKDDYSDVKFKIGAVAERLKIEFGVSVNDLMNKEVEEEVDLEELQIKVEKLRTRLSNFGEINPMAVESYNEMSERYSHIVTQRDDILRAKESLLKTIEEIEESATRMFMESFDQVRENFIVVFRSLFSEEDDCDLILIDPENPLESDIEIIAKPKGKKPKSLSQLSGGEKTLTATALLFSLYLLKPAPFCIFDEVDAPLDDANIQKFNKIIKKFSADSQFIIVTHNKATMSAVDILYGVYMQEQGVSSVTPVDFRNLDNQEYLETIA